MKAQSKKETNKAGLWLRIRRNWGLYLMLLPALILLFLFSYRPMYGVLISFKEYKAAKGILGSAWADPWFKYFKKFFDSFQFGTTIKNTLIITVYGLLVFPVPIILALGINQMRDGKYRKIFQTITYMPHFISTVVMVGLITLLLSPGSGVFGAESPTSLTFPKKPVAVFITIGLSRLFLFQGDDQSWSESYDGGFTSVKVTWTGNTVKWYTGHAEGQMNVNRRTYRVIALLQAG